MNTTEQLEVIELIREFRKLTDQVIVTGKCLNSFSDKKGIGAEKLGNAILSVATTINAATDAIEEKYL